ncbi:hypothetical protein ACTXNO_27270, partial [Pseudomonas helleri]
QTYLAPLPLPTEAEPCCPYISDYNDICLDFGGGQPNVYSYQIWLGGPFSSSFLMAFGFPLFCWVMVLALGGSSAESWEFAVDSFYAVWGYALFM